MRQNGTAFCLTRSVLSCSVAIARDLSAGPLTRGSQSCVIISAGLPEQADAEVAISTVLGSYLGRGSGHSEWGISRKWIRYDDSVPNYFQFITHPSSDNWALSTQERVTTTQRQASVEAARPPWRGLHRRLMICRMFRCLCWLFSWI